MKVLIIINHLTTGKAISRYLSFVYQIPSDYIILQTLVHRGTKPFLNYNTIVTETHDTNAVDYGVQFGKIFESHGVKITFFFTQNYFLPGYTIKDLPANSFYIPLQLKDFINHLKKNQFAEEASTKLEQILFSNPLTSSHH